MERKDSSTTIRLYIDHVLEMKRLALPPKITAIISIKGAALLNNWWSKYELVVMLAVIIGNSTKPCDSRLGT